MDVLKFFYCATSNNFEFIETLHKFAYVVFQQYSKYT